MRVEGQPEFELFDHRGDPLNMKNVADENPEVVEKLTAGLAKWREDAVAMRLASEAEVMATTSAEDLERLRSLGYLR